MFNQLSDEISEKKQDLKTEYQEKIQNLIDDPHVNINDPSKQLEAIKNSLSEVSDINEARILYFKSEIAIKNYLIDSEQIARKMLNIEPV